MINKILKYYDEIKKAFSYIKYDISILAKYKSKVIHCNKISDKKNKYKNEKYSNEKIAIHFHVFYVDLLPEIYEHLMSIKSNFTLFITVVNDEDINKVNNFFLEHKHSYEIKILKVENRGRDIYPFYKALHDCYMNYDIIAHFHTKKSFHTDFGNMWRHYIYENLLGHNFLFDNIIQLFRSKTKVGFVTIPVVPNKTIMKAYFAFVENSVSSKDIIEIALNKFEIPVEELYSNKENMDFPCGNMFIARTEAIKQFFSTELTRLDFPDEKGQTSGTLQHFVELMWKYMVNFNGFKYIEVKKR